MGRRPTSVSASGPSVVRQPFPRTASGATIADRKPRWTAAAAGHRPGDAAGGAGRGRRRRARRGWPTRGSRATATCCLTPSESSRTIRGTTTRRRCWRGLENPSPSTLPELVGAVCRRLRACDTPSDLLARATGPSRGGARTGATSRTIAERPRRAASALNLGVQAALLSDPPPEVSLVRAHQRRFHDGLARRRAEEFAILHQVRGHFNAPGLQHCEHVRREHLASAPGLRLEAGSSG